MSIKAIARVWDDAPFDGGKLLLALALADHANDDDTCWPSLAILAHRTRLSERHVRRLLRELEAVGFLQTTVGGIIGGEHKASVYKLMMDSMEGGQDVPHPVADVPHPPDTGVPHPGTPTSPQPSIEPPEEPSKETPTADGQLFDAPEQSARTPDPVQALWDYWEETFPGKNRGGLTPSRRTMLNKGMKAVNGEMDTCLRAIDGFAHWLKSNPTKNQRVDIGRVFATNLNENRSLTDKIYNWANDAPSTNTVGQARTPQHDHEVGKRQILVVEMYATPDNDRRARLGQEALAWLREKEGIEPILDEANRVRGWRDCV